MSITAQIQAAMSQMLQIADHSPAELITYTPDGLTAISNVPALVVRKATETNENMGADYDEQTAIFTVAESDVPSVRIDDRVMTSDGLTWHVSGLEPSATGSTSFQGTRSVPTGR